MPYSEPNLGLPRGAEARHSVQTARRGRVEGTAPAGQMRRAGAGRVVRVVTRRRGETRRRRLQASLAGRDHATVRTREAIASAVRQGPWQPSGGGPTRRRAQQEAAGEPGGRGCRLSPIVAAWLARFPRPRGRARGCGPKQSAACIFTDLCRGRIYVRGAALNNRLPRATNTRPCQRSDGRRSQQRRSPAAQAEQGD